MAVTLDGVKYLIETTFTRTRTPLSQLWVALTTEDIDPSATGADLYEPSGGYSRRSHAASSSGWNRVGSTLSNSAVVRFPKATEDWGQLTNWALCTHQTGGNVLFEDRLSEPITVEKGDVIEIPVGWMVIQFKVGSWSL